MKSAVTHPLTARELLDLGTAYDFGIEVRKNIKKAVGYYLASAKLGEPTAQYNLYISYRDGDGLPKNRKMATYWLKKAGEQKYPEALADLG